MSFQLEMQQVGNELIDEFGVAVKLTKNSGNQSGQSVTSKGVIIDVSSKDLQDSFITATDKIVFVKGTVGKRPAEGDVIYFPGSKNTYTIIKMETYNPDDIVANTCVYQCYVRP